MYMGISTGDDKHDKSRFLSPRYGTVVPFFVLYFIFPRIFWINFAVAGFAVDPKSRHPEASAGPTMIPEKTPNLN